MKPFCLFSYYFYGNKKKFAQKNKSKIKKIKNKNKIRNKK